MKETDINKWTTLTTKQIVSGNGEGYIRCVARPL